MYVLLCEVLGKSVYSVIIILKVNRGMSQVGMEFTGNHSTATECRSKVGPLFYYIFSSDLLRFINEL